jgi:hypothetical protein
MRLLLDSHAFIWAVEQPAKPSVAAITALQDPDNELVLSAGCGRESVRLTRRASAESLPPPPSRPHSRRPAPPAPSSQFPSPCRPWAQP